MSNRQSEREQAFGDAVYEAWRSGLDSDAVSRDRMDDDLARGYDYDEAVERELHRLRGTHLP